MVGVTGRTTDSPSDASFHESLEPFRHTERYDADVVLETDAYSVGTTAYPEYPTRTVENEDCWIYFEGRIYDELDRPLEDELLEVGERVLETDSESQYLTDWVLETDGEFLLVAYDKSSGRLGLLNDVLGRLPTYYYHDGDTFVFSRELRYLVDAVDGDEFDPLGVAHCLLFGYPLGERTLMRRATRLPPGTYLTFDPDDGTVTRTELHRFDFEYKAYANRTREGNAAELVDRFETACEKRSGYGSRDVISLSGGLDSRSVLAGYHVTDTPARGATMASEKNVPQSDVELAEKLARTFDIEWDLYQVGPARGEDLDTLIKTKNGHVGLLTSFILDFLRQLRADHGSGITYVTGDGGDKALPDLTPARSISSERELVDYVIEENAMLDLEHVARLTGLSAAEIRRSVRDLLRRYPERDFESKYVHFLVYERGVNFMFEGEDRNRQFFWSTTPFYSVDFFRYAMNCPDDQKARYALYREFLEQLSPEAAEHVHPDYGAPIASSRHAAAAFVDDLLSRYPRLFETVLPVIKSVNGLQTDSTVDPETVGCIQDQIDHCDAVGEVLSVERLREFLDSYSDHGQVPIYRLFVITSVIDDIHSSQSVLESRGDAIFG
ncbi:hypothetical protein [Haloterrigena alkaliphila]|uniref:hypothetical protein n=1 Tax=Haloterrigena alkaliphila TaxID=2816475 RepID=UPI001CFFE928|nr:hypothetical protein [Haloterrigena alkaliphila]UHQ95325.1 hypothetical protein J0X25_20880 [Haloterrigena alkaliphila]